MYLARFESGSVFLVTAALGWPEATLPGYTHWAGVLRRFAHVDAGLRVAGGRAAAQVVLILCAEAAALTELQACYDALLGELAHTGLTGARDAAEFDALTGLGSGPHLRVDHEGYHHRGVPLGCDFKLYAAFASDHSEPGATYQVNLKFHQPNPQTERLVLKHLAWLDLEQPFTEPVRTMQRALVERLRRPGWMANEYLAVADPATLAAWIQRIEAHFGQTTGRIGFHDLPLEQGDFSDFLVTAYHLARDSMVGANLPSRGAGLFAAEEVDWLLSNDFVASRTGASFGAAGGAPACGVHQLCV